RIAELDLVTVPPLVARHGRNRSRPPIADFLLTQAQRLVHADALDTALDGGLVVVDGNLQTRNRLRRLEHETQRLGDRTLGREVRVTALDTDVLIAVLGVERRIGHTEAPGV